MNIRTKPDLMMLWRLQLEEQRTVLQLQNDALLESQLKFYINLIKGTVHTFGIKPDIYLYFPKLERGEWGWKKGESKRRIIQVLSFL